MSVTIGQPTRAGVYRVQLLQTKVSFTNPLLTLTCRSNKGTNASFKLLFGNLTIESRISDTVANMGAPSNFSRPKLPSSPPSSGSLKGMEMAVPPPSHRSDSPFVPSYSPSPRHLTPRHHTPLPSPSRSLFSNSSTEKPLPRLPRKSSSIYSQDDNPDRYTRIIESYGNDLEPEPLRVIQPTAHRKTVAPILGHDEPPSPRSLTPASQFTSSRQQAQKGFSDSPVSSWSTESVPESSKAPSFKEFSQRLQKRKLTEPISPPLSVPSKSAPVFRAISYDSTKGHDGPPPRLYSPFTNEDLIPLPLSVRKSPEPLADDFSEPAATHRSLNPELKAYLDHGPQKSPSRFSDSSSDKPDNVYSYVRRKIRKRETERQNAKREQQRERDRVMSIASSKYPGMLNAKELDRRRSGSNSRPTSSGLARQLSVNIPRRVSSIYDKVSRLSISPTTSRSKDAKPITPRRSRQKQLAVPPSPYQLYGPAAWDLEEDEAGVKLKRDSSRRIRDSGKASRWSTPPKKRTMSNASAGVDEGRHRHVSMVDALRSGRSQIIHALGGGSKQGNEEKEEKRKDALKQSIRFVGLSDTVSDGVKTYRV